MRKLSEIRTSHIKITWNPLFEGFCSSNSHNSRVHAFGREYDSRAEKNYWKHYKKYIPKLIPYLPFCKSPSGFWNFIWRSDGHAMPVRNNGTIVCVECFRILSVSLNNELAIAPQGAIVRPLSSYANGAQSDDGVPNRPSSCSSSRDFTYLRWFW